MNRRILLQGLAAMTTLPLLLACASAPRKTGPVTVAALKHPDAFWRDKVSLATFEVLFEDDTERAFSSPLNMETKRDFILLLPRTKYHCALRRSPRPHFRRRPAAAGQARVNNGLALGLTPQGQPLPQLRG